MKIKRPKQITYMETEKVICNRCGREFNPSGDFMVCEDGEPMEVHSYEFTCGYHSKIGDMTKIEFDLCDDCLMEFIEQFQISAMTPPENQYNEADEAAVQEFWDALGQCSFSF